MTLTRSRPAASGRPSTSSRLRTPNLLDDLHAIAGLSAGSDDHSQAWLAASGIEPLDAHHAAWHLAGQRAEVTSDALDDLRVRLPWTPPATPDEALRAHGCLPANWRWADDRQGRALIADVAAGSNEASLAWFRDLESGVRWLQGGDQPDDGAAALAKPDVAPLMGSPYWDESSVVETADGWELRPTLAGHPTTVAVVLTGTRLRCRRVVLDDHGTGIVGDAICLQALRENVRLKHARLSLDGARLVAETCVPRELLAGPAIAMAVRAVAVAERRVRRGLAILRDHDDLASRFVELFARSDVPPDRSAATDLNHNAVEGR